MTDRDGPGWQKSVAPPKDELPPAGLPPKQSSEVAEIAMLRKALWQIARVNDTPEGAAGTCSPELQAFVLNVLQTEEARHSR